VYFIPAILGCFTKQMDAIIAIYLLPVFINGVCQTWIIAGMKYTSVEAQYIIKYDNIDKQEVNI
jgi:hypothetical protein